MPQDHPSVTAAPGRAWHRGTLWLLRLAWGVHAAMAVAQPVSAGLYLSGDLDAISLHSTIGGTLIFVGFLGMVAATLHWWPGRGPVWPAAATLVLLVAEVTQVSVGFSRTLGLHIPLGVAVVGVTVVLFAWSVFGRHQPRPRAAAP